MSKRMYAIASALFAFSTVFAASPVYTDPAGTVVNPTGLVVTDEKGQTYNIDSLLDMGKVLVIHPTYSG